MRAPKENVFNLRFIPDSFQENFERPFFSPKFQFKIVAKIMKDEVYLIHAFIQLKEVESNLYQSRQFWNLLLKSMETLCCEKFGRFQISHLRSKNIYSFKIFLEKVWCIFRRKHN